MTSFRRLCWLAGGSKKDRQGCEVLTLMLQTLQGIVTSEALPADRVLVRQFVNLRHDDEISDFNSALLYFS